MTQNFDDLVDSRERADIEKILSGNSVTRCPHLEGRGEYYFFCATELTGEQVNSADLTDPRNPAVKLRKGSNMLTYFCINRYESCIRCLEKEQTS